MSKPRSFDWDAAKSRWEAGETVTALALEYGVSRRAIWFACHPVGYAASLNARVELQRSGVCVDCGGQCSRNATDLRSGRRKGRCRACASKGQVLSVRDAELRCVTCREWLPDRRFPHSRSREHRRGRHMQCSVCGTLAKAAWRARKQALALSRATP